MQQRTQVSCARTSDAIETARYRNKCQLLSLWYLLRSSRKLIRCVRFPIVLYGMSLSSAVERQVGRSSVSHIVWGGSFVREQMRRLPAQEGPWSPKQCAQSFANTPKNHKLRLWEGLPSSHIRSLRLPLRLTGTPLAPGTAGSGHQVS